MPPPSPFQPGMPGPPSGLGGSDFSRMPPPFRGSGADLTGPPLPPGEVIVDARGNALDSIFWQDFASDADPVRPMYRPGDQIADAAGDYDNAVNEGRRIARQNNAPPEMYRPIDHSRFCHDIDERGTPKYDPNKTYTATDANNKIKNMDPAKVTDNHPDGSMGVILDANGNIMHSTVKRNDVWWQVNRPATDGTTSNTVIPSEAVPVPNVTDIQNTYFTMPDGSRRPAAWNNGTLKIYVPKSPPPAPSSRPSPRTTVP